jgi:hypothetical protein
MTWRNRSEHIKTALVIAAIVLIIFLMFLSYKPADNDYQAMNTGKEYKL